MNIFTRTILAILYFLFTITSSSIYGQTLNADGSTHDITGVGSFQEFTIPAAADLNGNNYLYLFAKGADGGKRKVGAVTHKGGGGAKAEVTFEIGTSAGQLKPGGRIRFILGEEGKSDNSGQVSGAGGGGGSGIIYTEASSISCTNVSTDIADAGSCWVILAVGGGGGGAYASGFGNGSDGKNGRNDESGSDGSGVDPGSGGQNGNGGGLPGSDDIQGQKPGGGGGAFTMGEIDDAEFDTPGRRGRFTGGDGGQSNSNSKRGGYGYGGGGAGIQIDFITFDASGGGGGGGFSGGGGGDTASGGGGGSFVNSAAIESETQNGKADGSPNNGKIKYQFKDEANVVVAKCKDLELTLVNGSITIVPDDVENGSIVEPGESINNGIFEFFTFSRTYTCADIGEQTLNYYIQSSSGVIDGCTSIIEVSDGVSPTLTCPSSPMVVTVTQNQDYLIDPSSIVQNATDDCGGTVTLYTEVEFFTCADIGMQTITIYGEDESDNTGSCEVTFNVFAGNEGPGITCPSDITVALGNVSNCPALVAGNQLTPSVTGNCASELTYEIASINGDVFASGMDALGNTSFPLATNVVTYTLGANNLAFPRTCSFTVTLQGGFQDDPLMECQNNLNFDLTAEDECSIFLAESSIIPFYNACFESTEVTFTFTDVDGQINTEGPFDGFAPGSRDFEIGETEVSFTGYYGTLSETCFFTVSVNDVTPPTAICKDLTITLAADKCTTLVPYSNLDDGSSDDCGSVELLVPGYTDCSTGPCLPVPPSYSAFLFGAGAHTVSFSVRDESGNTANCTQTVTLVDNTAPTATCQNTTVNLDAGGSATLAPGDIDDESSDNCGIVSYVLSESSFSCADVGMQTVSLTVSDAVGNESSCTATVTVADNSAPVISICPTSELIETNPGTCSFDVIDMNNLPSTAFVDGISDDCGTFTISQNPAPGTEIFTASVELTVIATDGFGNASDPCVITLIRTDLEAPSLICQNVTAYLGTDGTATVNVNEVVASVTDNCTANPSLSFHPVQIQSTRTYNCNQLGEQTVTIYSYDETGADPGICMATITVLDALAPDAVCQNLSVNLSSPMISASDLDDGSSDNCTDAASLGFNILLADEGNISVGSSLAVDCTDQGTLNLVLEVTDAEGNTSSCNAVVTVADDIPPTAVCVNQTVNIVTEPILISPPVLSAGSSDNCLSIMRSASQITFGCDDVGENTVTVTIDDGNNSSTCTALVTVVDATAPVAQCQGTTVALGATGTATLSAAQVDAGSSDNCGVANTAVDITSFDCSYLGNQTVTLTVTDESSNSSTCTAVVTVEDNLDPVALCQNATVQLDMSGMAMLAVTDIDNGSADNCGITNSAVDITNFDCSHVGNQTVILTVTDASSNSNTCNATVTILENTPPEANCKNATVQLDQNGEATLSSNQVDDNSNDACGIQSLDISQTSFDCSDVGTQNVELVVTDNFGNTATCSASISVVEDQGPIALCQNATVELDAGGSATLAPTEVDAGSSDNCGIVSSALDISSFDCSHVGNQTVTLTVTDGSGNSSTCTAQVSVEDNIMPNALCQNVTVELGEDGTATLTLEEVDTGSTDNCEILGSYITFSEFDCQNLGPNNGGALIVSDVNGNTGICQYYITVEDNLAPTVICQNAVVQLDMSGSATLATSDINFSSSDNCGIANLQLDQMIFDCTDIGVQTVTLTATDDTGNMGTCTANVTVEGFPCGWQDLGGIGCYDNANTSSYNNSIFSLTANNCAPEFPYANESTAFAFTELCGDGEIIAEVTNVQGVGYAGVMMRDDLSPNAPMAAMGTNRINRVRKQARVLPGYPAYPQQVLSFDKFWVRLVRSGNQFFGYASTDGSSWFPYINQQIFMNNNCIQIGLFVYSEKPGNPATATFTDVYVTGQVIPLVSMPTTVLQGETIALLPTINVFPNPTQDVLYIDLSSYLGQRAEVQLFNSLGKLVRQDRYDETLATQQLDVSALAPGIYSLMVAIDDQKIAKRIVISRQ